MKDTIVQWRGGGYDGCFWEPNTGFFDANEVWHPIISTGAGARATLVDFNSQKDGHWGDDITYPITKEGCLEFQENIRADFFMSTLRRLSDAGYAVYFRCARCGAALPYDEFSSEFEGYRGDGGIGIIYEGPLCSECYNEGICERCHTYMGKEELVEDVCWHCWEYVKRARPKLAAKLQKLQLDIVVSEQELARYSALVPKYAAKAARVCAEVNAERNEAITELRRKMLRGEE